MNSMTGQAVCADGATVSRIRLRLSDFGKLQAEVGGVMHENVQPVRAFPVGAPDQCISLVGPDGHERAWIQDPALLEKADRDLLMAELRKREFMPELKRLVSVNTFHTPSTWEVETDRGRTGFVLKSEDSIRRLGERMLLVADGDGIHYLVRDLNAMDRASRKLFDRFL